MLSCFQVRRARALRVSRRSRLRNFRASPRGLAAIPVPVSSGRSAVAAETEAEADAQTVAATAARIVAEAVTVDVGASNAGPAVAASRIAATTAIPATGIRAVRN